MSLHKQVHSGVEFAGHIEQLGEGATGDFKVGDEVFGLAYGGAASLPVLLHSQLCGSYKITLLASEIGAYAEYIATSTRMLNPQTGLALLGGSSRHPGDLDNSDSSAAPGRLLPARRPRVLPRGRVSRFHSGDPARSGGWRVRGLHHRGLG